MYLGFINISWISQTSVLWGCEDDKHCSEEYNSLLLILFHCILAFMYWNMADLAYDAGCRAKQKPCSCICFWKVKWWYFKSNTNWQVWRLTKFWQWYNCPAWPLAPSKKCHYSLWPPFWDTPSAVNHLGLWFRQWLTLNNYKESLEVVLRAVYSKQENSRSLHDIAQGKSREK